ncbi:hypothetical protein TWF730_004483 [Orbilia blumenaviensis]|uniref:Uncharacterized protein n=1 Tax=Orbilia blumenaviensis TaxID=1796055 RepID=A0AAV9TYK2_9PEZI
MANIQQPNASFLTLPREIRDEIYECLFTGYTPKLLPHTDHLLQNLDTPEKPNEPCAISLDILRVSKQIHNEAASVFYGRSAFPIRVLRSDSPSITEGIYMSYLSQETPWEFLHYRYFWKDGNLCSQNPAQNLTPGLPTLNENTLIVIKPTYGNLIRKIRIDAIDCHGRLNTSDLSRSSTQAMKLLIPVVERLANVLGGPNRRNKLEVEINCASVIIDSHIRSEENIGLMAGIPPGLIANTSAESLAGLYKGMIATIWPLTKGPWEYNIKIPLELSRHFPMVLEKELERCEKKMEEEGWEWRSWKISPSFWELWHKHGTKLNYVGQGEKEVNSMDEDDL